MSLQNIRSALAQAFQSGGFGLPVVYENAPRSTQANAPWAEFFFIPNQPVVRTLGDQGQDEHTGIVQINLNYPLHEGPGRVLQKADQIRAVFKAGAAFTHTGQVVHIRSSGLSRAPQIEGGFFQCIFTIQWRANTAR
jgi:hypothetical protein